MKRLSGVMLVAALAGMAAGAALAQSPANVGQTYSVTNQSCHLEPNGLGCGACTTSYTTDTTCTSGAECVGFKCGISANYSACSSNEQSGSCIMKASLQQIMGCIGCNIFYGDPACCVEMGTCTSPGCGEGTREAGVTGSPAALCVAG
jgi:hypothetical protein